MRGLREREAAAGGILDRGAVNLDYSVGSVTGRGTAGLCLGTGCG